MIELRLLFLRRIGNAVCVGEHAVHVVKAVVLGVNHNDVFDAIYICPTSGIDSTGANKRNSEC
ncbi:MAG: hypothetical protein JWN13_1280 [Betaproteobacteria bacterium]|nr:hypothetical protein [Betaproteobacteria bacterium]